jgi:hypothetical protein
MRAQHFCLASVYIFFSKCIIILYCENTIIFFCTQSIFFSKFSIRLFVINVPGMYFENENIILFNVFQSITIAIVVINLNTNIDCQKFNLKNKHCPCLWQFLEIFLRKHRLPWVVAGLFFLKYCGFADSLKSNCHLH